MADIFKKQIIGLPQQEVKTQPHTGEKSNNPFWGTVFDFFEETVTVSNQNQEQKDFDRRVKELAMLQGLLKSDTGNNLNLNL